MSKYHPLDIRHPKNRDLLSRNYLLDPPRQTPQAHPPKGARPTPAPRAEAKTSAQPVQASANPWTTVRNAVGATQARTRAAATSLAPASAPRERKRSSWRWVVIFIAIVAVMRAGGFEGVQAWFNDLRAALPVTSESPSAPPLPALDLTPSAPVNDPGTGKP